MGISAPKNLRYWLFCINTICVAFLAWDFFDRPRIYHLDLFYEVNNFFLLFFLPLFSIGWVVSVIKPILGARITKLVALLSLVFYFCFGAVNIIFPRGYFADILIFYIPRIFVLGTSLVFSQKILQAPSEQEEFILSIFSLNIHLTMKEQKFIATGFLAVIGIIGIIWLSPRAICHLDGGEWVRDGLYGQGVYCLYQYPDAGKTCNNSSDCMGNCILEEEIIDINDIPSTGVCAPDNRGYGCRTYFENQKVLSLCSD